MILNNSSETDLCIYLWQYYLCNKLFCLDPQYAVKFKVVKKFLETYVIRSEVWPFSVLYLPVMLKNKVF